MLFERWAMNRDPFYIGPTTLHSCMQDACHLFALQLPSHKIHGICSPATPEGDEFVCHYFVVHTQSINSRTIDYIRKKRITITVCLSLFFYWISMGISFSGCF